MAVYYLVYDNIGNIKECVNQIDETKQLLEITEQQYINFIEGIHQISNYEVKIIDNTPTLIAKAIEKEPIVVYKTTQLKKVHNINNPDIELHFENKNLIAKLKKPLTNISKINLYLTTKNNPIRFEEIIELDYKLLEIKKELSWQICYESSSQISIYTVSKNIVFGLKDE